MVERPTRGRKPPCPATEPAQAKKESKGPKPNLFNLHHKMSMRNVYVACGISVLSGIAFYFAVSRPRRQTYKQFYAEYDPDASFSRMSEAGLFTSINMEPEDPKKK